MGFFDLFRTGDINKGVEEWKKTEGSVLLDVRTEGEYKKGHIHGSVNLPLNEIERIGEFVPKKDTTIFVHCHSGGRSGLAVKKLKKMGYTDARDFGGINKYRGELEV